MAHPIILAIAGLALTRGGSKRSRPNKTRKRTNNPKGRRIVRDTRRRARGMPPRTRKPLPDIEDGEPEEGNVKVIRPNFAEISRRSAPNQLGGMSLTPDGQHGAVSPNWWVIHQHRVIAQASEDLNWTPDDANITAEEIALEVVKREAPDFDWSTIGEEGWGQKYPGARTVFLSVLGHIESLVARVSDGPAVLASARASAQEAAAQADEQAQTEGQVEAKAEEAKPAKKKTRRKRKSRAKPKAEVKGDSDDTGDASASGGESSGPDAPASSEAEAG